MKIYLVGGAVRDFLLGLPLKDKDWVVVGSTPKDMINKGYKKIGRDFPVFIHPKTCEEYALARTERKVRLGYSGFCVNFSKKITLKEDLRRRDLTINAIAQDNKGKFIDPFGGQKDIKNRIIRHVSISFKEDPIRILRVARFAANLNHLGFVIFKDTFLLMKNINLKKELLYLFPDRIWKEIEKGFKALNPHIFFQVLYDCNALFYIFPEMYKLYQELKNSSIFFSGVVLSRFCMEEVFRVSKFTTNISIRFSYFFQFFGRYFFSSFKRNKYVFFDEQASLLIKKMCIRLKIPSEIRKLSMLMCGFHIFLQTLYVQSSFSIVMFFNKFDIWRKPDRLIALGYLKYYYLKNSSIYKENFSLGKFLKKIYLIINKISVRSFSSKKKFKGSEIRDELFRLRVEVLKKWLFKHKKNTYKY